MPAPHEPVSYRWVELDGRPNSAYAEEHDVLDILGRDRHAHSLITHTAQPKDTLRFTLANGQLITVRRKPS